MTIFAITVQRRASDRAPVVVEYRQRGGLPMRREGDLELAEEYSGNADISLFWDSAADFGRGLPQRLR